MILKNLSLCFLGAALATAALTSGCRGHHDHDRDQPAASETQPAPNETVIYNNWETQTHRPHKELNQRPVEEQNQYQEWRRAHPNGR